MRVIAPGTFWMWDTYLRQCQGWRRPIFLGGVQCLPTVSLRKGGCRPARKESAHFPSVTHSSLMLRNLARCSHMRHTTIHLAFRPPRSTFYAPERFLRHPREQRSHQTAQRIERVSHPLSFGNPRCPYSDSWILQFAGYYG